MKSHPALFTRLFIVVTFFGLLLSTSSLEAGIKPGNEISFFYLESHMAQPVFCLALDRESTDFYQVTVKAKDGSILYAEKIKKDRSTRFYKLDPEYNDQLKGTSFEILNLNTGKTVVFKIETNIKTTETVSLVKL